MEEQTIKKIIAYFEENADVFNRCMEELDSYNGYLNDSRYYPMEDLNEFYQSAEPLELLRRAYYGHDEDTYTTDGSGNRTYGEFNPNRDYFTFNGYGNLVSTDYIDYTVHLDRYAVEAMAENRAYIDNIEDDEELAALFDELEQEESEV